MHQLHNWLILRHFFQILNCVNFVIVGFRCVFNQFCSKLVPYRPGLEFCATALVYIFQEQCTILNMLCKVLIIIFTHVSNSWLADTSKTCLSMQTWTLYIHTASSSNAMLWCMHGQPCRTSEGQPTNLTIHTPRKTKKLREMEILSGGWLAGWPIHNNNSMGTKHWGLYISD